MVEEFDVIYFGTSIKDSLAVRKYCNSKVLVIDNKKTFGDSIVQKNCSIDKIPILMRKNDILINELVSMKMHLFVDFVNIKNQLYFNKDKTTIKYHKIPTTKAELSQSPFITNKDKLLINKYIKGGSLNIDQLENATVTIFRKSIMDGGNDMEALKRYFTSFNTYELLFPVYGYNNICENIVRCNAINGITYLLDPSLKIDTSDGATIIRSKYGTFSTRNFVDNKKTLTGGQYVTAVCYDIPFHLPSFYGVFDISKLIHCIALDSKSKICPENMYLLYIWHKSERITNADLIDIGIEMAHVIYQVDFPTDSFVYDYYDWYG